MKFSCKPVQFLVLLLATCTYASAQETSTTPTGGATQTQAGHPASTTTPPKLVHSVEPKLTPEAKKNHISGVVLVDLIIDETGMPQNVHVARGLGYGLDEEAVKTVSQFRFKPAKRDGHPVKVELTVTVSFQ